MEAFRMFSYYRNERKRLKNRASIICPNITTKIILITLVSFLLFSSLFVAIASAETMYVFCDPNSDVNIRSSHSTNSRVEGKLTLGDMVIYNNISSDGRWVYFVDLGIEAGGGWINMQYLTDEQIVIRTFNGKISSRGRVAARKSPGGQRKDWLYDGDSVTVYAIAGEWAVTNKGYVMAKYIGGV